MSVLKTCMHTPLLPGIHFSPGCSKKPCMITVSDEEGFGCAHTALWGAGCGGRATTGERRR